VRTHPKIVILKQLQTHFKAKCEKRNAVPTRYRPTAPLGICTLSWTLPHFGLLLYCRRFVQYCVRNCESTLMQLWKCFTVSPLRSACLPMHQTTMKTKVRHMQRACKTRWLSREAAVRTRSEILAIWAALKQLSENKNDAMCVVLLRLTKTKSFNVVLCFVDFDTSPDRTEQSFSGGMF